MESRALFFNAQICRLISKRCVPFARNSLVKSGYAADDAFWTRLQDQGVDMGNSMFLCSADGKAMAGFKDRNLGAWLASWDKLPQALRRPGALKIEQRGPYSEDSRNPRPPAGAMFVKTYMRALDRDAKGRLFAPDKLSLGVSKTVIKSEPNRDFLWITEAEWKRLIPTAMAKSEVVVMPAPLHERICRFHLVDGACCLPGFWPRKELQGGEVKLVVREVTSSVVRMKLEGSARLGAKERAIDFDLQGVLEFDVRNGAFTCFDAVATSKTGCHRDTASGKLLPIGVAFELGRENSPADCRPPYRIWYDKYGLNDYFGPVAP